jgi:hypothetical protein
MALFEEGTLDTQGVRFMTLRKCLEGELAKTGSNYQRAYVTATLYNKIPVCNILHKIIVSLLIFQLCMALKIYGVVYCTMSFGEWIPKFQKNILPQSSE